MAVPIITPGVPATPVDSMGTPAIDPTGRGASERRWQRTGRRTPPMVRPEEPDDHEDEPPPRPAPGRIDVIA